VAAARHYSQFLSSLRGGRFDLVVDLQGLFRSGLLAALTGARRRVGLAGAREGARWFYTDVIPVPDADNTHAVDRYWRVAEALGAGDGPKTFQVPIPDDARAWAAGQLSGLPRPWLAFGVGARWMTKRWPADHFAELARRAQTRAGGTAVFVGGNDEVPL